MSSKIANAFGHFPTGEIVSEDCTNHFLNQFSCEVDKETGSTSVVLTGTIDTDEIIQSYKDDCGMDYVQRLIRTGLADSSSFADKGDGSVDLTGSTTSINEAYQNSLAAQEATKKIADSFGITDYKDGDDLTSKITEKVQSIIKEQTAAAATSSEVK